MLKFYHSLFAVMFLHGALAINIVYSERKPENPFPVESPNVLLKVVLEDITGGWDLCNWEHDSIPVCKQTKQATGNPVPCLNDTFARSSELNGGNYSPTTCQLEIVNPNPMDNGEWKVTVYDQTGVDNFEKVSMSFTVYASSETSASFPEANIDDVFNLANNEEVAITCEAVHGIPETERFEWKINDDILEGSHGNVNSSSWDFDLLTIIYSDDDVCFGNGEDEKCYRNVSQVAKLTPSTEGEFILTCQPIQDDNAPQAAIATMSVTKDGGGGGNTGKGLATKWIVVIAVLGGLAVLAVILVLVCFCLGVACFSTDKQTKKEKQQEAERRRKEMIERQNKNKIDPPVVQQTYVVGQDYQQRRARNNEQVQRQSSFNPSYQSSSYEDNDRLPPQTTQLNHGFNSGFVPIRTSRPNPSHPSQYNNLDRYPSSRSSAHRGELV